MYRRTRKYTAERLAAMKAGKDRARMERPAPDYPLPLPELRMRITVERFDSDETQQALGAKLGLHPSVIGRIRTGHSWREAAPAASVFTMRP